jgi:hypothetical protein
VRPDSSAILNAVVAKLGADTELLALTPNGVYEDLSPPNATRFVIVSQILATDTAVLHQGRVIEDALLLVEARARSSANGDVRAAAARIDTLLEDGTLDIPNYRLRAMYREEFVRGTEIDEVDPSIVWKRRGGRYRVQVYREPTASVVALEPLAPIQGRFAVMDVGVWFDGPLRVPWAGLPAPWPVISIVAHSSDPARWPDLGLTYRPFESQPAVDDPSAPGRGMLYFRQVLDAEALVGMTFTVDATSAQVGWDQILNAESGEPVDPSLGTLVLTMTVVA